MDINFCPFCGGHHSTGTIFCPETGMKMERGKKHCLSCGETVPQEAQFCPVCGEVIKKPIQRDPVQQYEKSIPSVESPQESSLFFLNTQSEHLPSGNKPDAIVEPLTESKNIPDSSTNPKNEFPSFPKITRFALIALAIFTCSAWGGYVWSAKTDETNAVIKVEIHPTSMDQILLPTNTAISNPEATQITITETPTPLPLAEESPLPSSSRTIMYSYGDVENERALYSLNIDTGVAVSIASFSGGINFPAPAPGGDQVVFAGRTGSQLGDWNLYLLNVTQGTSELLVEKGVIPDWCRNAEKPWVVYEMRNGETSTLWMINLQDRQPRQLTTGGTEYRPKWNPDCTEIVFSQSSVVTLGDLQVYNLDSGQIQPITTTNKDDSTPIWSPNGQWIAFSRRYEDTNGDHVLNASDLSKLYLIRPDGSDERVINNVQISVFSPSWSPDSTQLVFTVLNENGGSQIMLYSIPDGQMFQLTDPGSYYHTRWVP